MNIRLSTQEKGNIMSEYPEILVVDDDVNIGRLIRLYLEKEGHSVECIHRGDTAIETFKNTNPKLILLDIMLPGMDGWSVCREIRKSSNVPIIMLTAKGETFDKVLGLELGADEVASDGVALLGERIESGAAADRGEGEFVAVVLLRDESLSGLLKGLGGEGAGVNQFLHGLPHVVADVLGTGLVEGLRLGLGDGMTGLVWLVDVNQDALDCNLFGHWFLLYDRVGY